MKKIQDAAKNQKKCPIPGVDQSQVACGSGQADLVFDSVAGNQSMSGRLELDEFWGLFQSKPFHDSKMRSVISYKNWRFFASQTEETVGISIQRKYCQHLCFLHFSSMLRSNHRWKSKMNKAKEPSRSNETVEAWTKLLLGKERMQWRKKAQNILEDKVKGNTQGSYWRKGTRCQESWGSGVKCPPRGRKREENSGTCTE